MNDDASGLLETLTDMAHQTEILLKYEYAVRNPRKSLPSRTGLWSWAVTKKVMSVEHYLMATVSLQNVCDYLEITSPFPFKFADFNYKGIAK